MYIKNINKNNYELHIKSLLKNYEKKYLLIAFIKFTKNEKLKFLIFNSNLLFFLVNYKICQNYSLSYLAKFNYELKANPLNLTIF